MFHNAVKFARFPGNCLRPPAFLGEADAMFAADGAAPGNDLRKQFVERRPGARLGVRLGEVHHHVGVDVAVAGMTETRDGQAMFFLQIRRKLEEIFQSSARNNNIFIQLCEAGVAQGVGKFAADLPDRLTFPVAKATFDKQRLLPADDLFQLLQLAPDGIFLAIEFGDKMGAAAAQAFAFGAFGKRRRG